MNVKKRTERIKREEGKVKEARYLIVIPMLVTLVCAWLDIWTNYASGMYTATVNDFINGKYIGTFMLQDGTDGVVTVYQHMPIMQGVTIFISVVRCVIGYLVPSILSIIIAMVWQQTVLKVKPYGLQSDKVGKAMFATVFYTLAFISCLIKYNLFTAIFVIIASFVYIFYIYAKCIDNRIKPKKKYEMTENELLLSHLNKKKEV